MREWVIECDQAEAEHISEVLMQCWDLGVLSVSVEDANEGTNQENPLFGEPGFEPEVQSWERNRVVCLIGDDLKIKDLLEALYLATNKDYQGLYSIREVPDEDWVRLTQAQFDPIQINEGIWIVPSWHKEHPSLKNESNSIHIELDPGLAFGTGSHPTTKLCAGALSSMSLEGLSVLDYGCGSGILSLISKKLNAQMVVGVDIDPQAVESSRFNAENNQLGIDFFLPNQMPDGRFDVVVANILTNPLKMLAPMLSGKVKNNGVLILSGILDTQADSVIEVYKPWIKLEVFEILEGWVCLKGTK